jgi:hypothetical protein
MTTRPPPTFTTLLDALCPASRRLGVPNAKHCVAVLKEKEWRHEHCACGKAQWPTQAYPPTAI